MARFKQSNPLGLISGMLGKSVVFRVKGNQIIIAAAPSSPKTETEAQKQQRHRFKEAMQFAKKQMANPETKAAYAAMAQQRNLPNAYNAAVADYFNPPVIGHIDTTQYTGLPGQRICIRATDDFRVQQVWVQLINAAGQLLEEGEAQLQPNYVDWVYIAKVNNLLASETKVLVQAKDMAGNVGGGESGKG